MPTWTSPPHPLLRNAFVGCRVGVIVLHDSFRDASAPVLRGIPGKRDYFSQFAKQMLPLCSPLPRQEFVFVSPLLASAAPFLSPSLLSLPSSSPRLAVSTSDRIFSPFFFLPFFSPPPLFTCAHVVVFVIVVVVVVVVVHALAFIFANIHTSLPLPPGVLHDTHPLLDVVVDTERERERRAKARTAGGCIF